jgi:hypothetical protein
MRQKYDMIDVDSLAAAAGRAGVNLLEKAT